MENKEQKSLPRFKEFVTNDGTVLGVAVNADSFWDFYFSTESRSFHKDLLEGLFGTTRFDFVFADPPYFTTDAKFDKKKDGSNLTPKRLGGILKRALKPKCVACICSAPPFTFQLYNGMAEHGIGFRFQYTWIKKRPTSFQNVRNQPMKKCETVGVFEPEPDEDTYNYHTEKIDVYSNGSEQHSYYAPKFIAKKKEVKVMKAKEEQSPSQNLGTQSSAGLAIVSDRKAVNDLLHDWFTELDGGVWHITPKPVTMVMRMIMTYCIPDGVVFDPCSGSGVTAKAAYLSGRKFCIIEKDTEFYDRTVEELKAFMLSNDFGGSLKDPDFDHRVWLAASERVSENETGEQASLFGGAETNVAYSKKEESPEKSRKSKAKASDPNQIGLF
jgi:site-specific DNA-methyltransferase (adenine-specific)